jgi:hypothetical protein
VWERVFQALCCEADNEYAAIDATMVRAHQHSAEAQVSCAEDENICRSRGGLSTKIHAVVDALGSPISFFDGRLDQLTCGSLGVTAAAVEAEAILARSKLTMLRRE